MVVNDGEKDWNSESNEDKENKVGHDLKIFIDFSEYAGQEDTNFDNSVQRDNDFAQTSLDMCTSFRTNFDQQNHTTTSLVRSYDNIPVIRSQKH